MIFVIYWNKLKIIKANFICGFPHVLNTTIRKKIKILILRIFLLGPL